MQRWLLRAFLEPGFFEQFFGLLRKLLIEGRCFGAQHIEFFVHLRGVLRWTQNILEHLVSRGGDVAQLLVKLVKREIYRRNLGPTAVVLAGRESLR